MNFFHRKKGGPPTLEEILELEKQEVSLLEKIEQDVAPKRLTTIKVTFKGVTMGTTPSGPVAGPVTLTTAGQQVVASVLGFDQFGNPFAGTIPTPTFSSSDTTGAVVTFDPTTDIVTAVANGTAGITASVSTTDANGNPITLTDTETVTVAIPVAPPPTPVLTSIKVAFAPTAAVVPAEKK